MTLWFQKISHTESAAADRDSLLLSHRLMRLWRRRAPLAQGDCRGCVSEGSPWEKYDLMRKKTILVFRNGTSNEKNTAR
jgi:hypothetical protein